MQVSEKGWAPLRTYLNIMAGEEMLGLRTEVDHGSNEDPPHNGFVQNSRGSTRYTSVPSVQTGRKAQLR